MRIKKGINILCLLLALCGGLVAHAQNQVEFRTPGSDSIKVIDILRNDSYRYDQTDTANPYQTLVGNVAIKQEKTIIYCDSMIMHPHAGYIDCFGHVHINDNDSVNIYSDHLN